MADAVAEEELERYLHEHIPLSAAMGTRVREASLHRVELTAPLAPNINHRETLFGGSAAALAVLSAWALLNLRMQAHGLEGRLVVQQNTMIYDEPVSGDFAAVAELTDEAAWQRFCRMFQRHGKARMSLTARIMYQERA